MIERILNIVLGRDPKQRLCLTRTLGAAGVFLVCLVFQYAGVLLGWVDRTQALLLSLLIVLGLSVFYTVIRSGRTLKRPDPALTMHQMVFAIVVLTLSYGVNPVLRGLMPMIVALVLVFGAFILTPARCRQLGWLSVACLTVMMLACALYRPQIFPPRIELFHFMLSALVLPAIAGLAAQLSALRMKLRLQKDALREALDRVHQLATRDDLTGLPNRRHAYELWDHEQQRGTRHNAPLCISLMDIDHFKHINDKLGHQAGDDALRVLSRILSKTLRAGDVLARWGGEEFMLILPSTAIEEAKKVAERMRLHCADPKNWVENPAIKVTFSAGLTAQVSGETRDATVARADAALYAAKHGGRDRVIVS